MKRIITVFAGLSLAVGATIAGTSCNKEQDWNCKCTVNGNETTTVIRDKTRKEAKAECDKSGSVLGVEYDCDLQLF